MRKSSTRSTQRTLLAKSAMRCWRLRQGTRRYTPGLTFARVSSARVEQQTDWLSPSGFTSDCLEDEPGANQEQGRLALPLGNSTGTLDCCGTASHSPPNSASPL